VKIYYPMSYDAWANAITHATESMNAGEMQKVVLARIAEIRQPQSIDMDAALDYLAERYPDCYRFLFEPQAGHAFYGATPELLARVQGHQVATMGLAGSIKRGANADEDMALGRQLLHDAKERYEHALVVDEIKRRLEPMTETLHVPSEPTLYKLSNIQHLYTPINGWMREARGVLPLVELLHPTPALGGQPREAAMDFICEAEPAPRGWYAAPVGFLDHQLDGAFAVAIRSAVVQDRRAWLYAGAGIVADSQPQKEWDETALKFRPMLGALGIESL
jgi:menaquinone-specific isochorismate synthase